MRSRAPVRRRLVVIVLGAIVAAVACAILGVAFVRGSWWYSYGTDRALNGESRARLEAIRDEVEASGAAPEAVMWLEAALEPGVDPTDVRIYLITARETIGAADDPALAEAARELQAIIGRIQSASTYPAAIDIATTPYIVSTPVWPER